MGRAHVTPIALRTNTVVWSTQFVRDRRAGSRHACSTSCARSGVKLASLRWGGGPEGPNAPRPSSTPRRPNHPSGDARVVVAGRSLSHVPQPSVGRCAAPKPAQSSPRWRRTGQRKDARKVFRAMRSSGASQGNVACQLSAHLASSRSRMPRLQVSHRFPVSTCSFPSAIPRCPIRSTPLCLLAAGSP